MSLHSYRRAIELYAADEPFDALIMAALLRADTSNHEILTAAFPEVAAELAERYHAPGGLREGEPGRAELDRRREALGMPPA